MVWKLRKLDKEINLELLSFKVQETEAPRELFPAGQKNTANPKSHALKPFRNNIWSSHSLWTFLGPILDDF